MIRKVESHRTVVSDLFVLSRLFCGAVYKSNVRLDDSVRTLPYEDLRKARGRRRGSSDQHWQQQAASSQQSPSPFDVSLNIEYINLTDVVGDRSASRSCNWKLGQQQTTTAHGIAEAGIVFFFFLLGACAFKR